eukprot:14829065-Alexandrium_andersonii.AAC.1
MQWQAAARDCKQRQACSATCQKCHKPHCACLKHADHRLKRHQGELGGAAIAATRGRRSEVPASTCKPLQSLASHAGP